MSNIIAIQGIRVDSVGIETSDSGVVKITASYSLISTSNKVLAKQSIGGYNDIKVEPAADTVKLLNSFLKSYRRDINSVLGLEETEMVPATQLAVT